MSLVFRQRAGSIRATEPMLKFSAELARDFAILSLGLAPIGRGISSLAVPTRIGLCLLGCQRLVVSATGTVSPAVPLGVWHAGKPLRYCGLATLVHSHPTLHKNRLTVSRREVLRSASCCNTDLTSTSRRRTRLGGGWKRHRQGFLQPDWPEFGATVRKSLRLAVALDWRQENEARPVKLDIVPHRRAPSPRTEARIIGRVHLERVG